MGPLTAVLLIPLVLIVALSVDLGNVWKTEAELQNAADSAALAGAGALLSYNGDYLGTTDSGLQQTARTNGIAAAKTQAQTYGQYHMGGFKQLVVNITDVKVGYIATPTDASSPFVEDTGTSSSSPFPNAVQVKTRRDSTVSTGSLPLYFSRVIGWNSADPWATATAATKVQSISGFKGDNTGLLPVVMNINVYNWLVSDMKGQKPKNVRDMGDQYVVENPLTSTLSAPNNVYSGKDGKDEASIYNYQTKKNDPTVDDTTLASGNWGLIDLINGQNGSPGNQDISRWIQQGPTGSEINTWNSVTNNNGFYATRQQPLTMNVQTGFQTSNQNDFQAIIGQPRVMPVFTTVSGGSGGNSSYQIVGFVGVTIVNSDLAGNTGRSYVAVQLTSVLVNSPDEVLTPTSSSSTSNVYSGNVSLCR